ETAVMVVVPVVRLVARPELLIVAMLVLEEIQITEVVMFWLLPSVYVPAAVNCWVTPTKIEGLAGVTVIVVSDAPVTVRVVEPVIEPEAALMVVVPIAMLAAKPILLMVATPPVEELQETDAVMF